MIVITLTSVRKSNNRHFKSFNSGGTYQMPRALNLRFRAPLPFSGKGALSVDDKSTASAACLGNGETNRSLLRRSGADYTPGAWKNRQENELITNESGRYLE
jgi:hypothetical protein